MLETFFRRWWLYLLVLVPFIALAVVTIGNTGKTFHSTSDILVNQSSDAGDKPFGNDTPAVFTSKQMNSALGTDSFLTSLIAAAGRPRIGNDEMTAQQVKSSISIAPNGDSLVTINTAAADAGLSKRLADETFTTYIKYVIDNARESAQKAQDLYDKLSRGPKL